MNRKKIIAGLGFAMLTSFSASAQTRVLLKPVVQTGQETRYSVNAVVDTRVTPQGADGITSSVHREVTATLLVRAATVAPSSVNGTTSESGVPQSNLTRYEFAIESLSASTVVDGAEKRLSSPNLVGRSILLTVDASGTLVRSEMPPDASRIGLGEIVISLFGWAPAAPVAVGESWGSSGADQFVGVFSYIAAPGMSDIAKGSTTHYTLSGLNGGRAVVDGAIELNQKGGLLMQIPSGPTKVNGIASGTGTTRIEYDVTAGRLASATTETSVKGRLVNVPPVRDGQPMQVREGALVETARFTIAPVPSPGT
jgi:hypothetical protein